MTYKQVAPNLSKFINEADVTSDVKAPLSNAINENGEPELTSEKVNLIFPHLRYIGASSYPSTVTKKSAKEVAKLAGVTVKQVEMLKKEYFAARSEKLESLRAVEEVI
ncbi:hypothetical protein KAU11_09970 [Candidatus Babeliales bacterium]|nr:hypothetical protein [Candidatus Babeliales bacterium]